ncbi:glycerol-3-phosphate responsive antiterminator [Brevibacillus sp. SYP-B805]|uniref:glycerol-3-phosphate responsive antiterminator n=1 Tax=Brevibacillus sp. SYP-B805 TaxID=1578199 RepID=UPI0013EAED84|nr:glycerol-3-phosphate responsive antiterminator [Brevibacillus sp. SYP-B805]
MEGCLHQKILPAIRNLKDFDELLDSEFERLVLLNIHIAQLKAVVNRAKEHKKKIFVHADLIDGLKSDEYATEYLAQEIRPEGIITTRNNVILTARKKGIISIQRLFLIDTMALENSLAQLERTKPDYVEVLPGVIPRMIREISQRIPIPIIAGGLIRTREDVERALQAGATSVTTSRKELWAAPNK